MTRPTTESSAHPLGRRRFLALAGGVAADDPRRLRHGRCDEDAGDAGATAAATDRLRPRRTDGRRTAHHHGSAPAPRPPAASSAAAAATARSGSATSRRRPARWRRSARPTTSSSAAIEEFLADGLMVGGMTLHGRDHRQGQRVRPRPRGATGAELINDDGVDLMRRRQHARDHQPGRRPVRGQRRAVHLHLAPWQPWFIGRGGDPGEASFEWTYHFFWGLEDVIAVFTAMWNQIETNKAVGGLFPNDGDGNAWGDPERRASRRRSPRPATRSSTPAATRTATRTSRPRSPRSRTPAPRSSPAC